MKILMPVLDMMDYGGIINYTEILAQAFEELGHSVTVVILRNMVKDPYVNKFETHIQGAYKSHVANMAHTTEGWYGIKVYGYGDKRQRNTWRRFTDKFDFVLHQIPVPEADKDGNWKKLYNIHVPQVVASHDAHFRERYPHMIDIAHKLVGVAAVNEASYNNLAALPVRRCFIGSPHIPLVEDWDAMHRWRRRSERFISAHVWKPWKHMDLVVRSIPELRDGIQNRMVGDGIEARYMRSKDKCKPRYKGIWKRALKHGMDYRGMVPADEIGKLMQRCRVMVDMSFSKKFLPYGNHVNRSTLDAYNFGCVPLVTTENMLERDSKLFRVGRTHAQIPAASSPQQLAHAIEAVMDMDPREAERIIANGRKLLMKYWDYHFCAESFINLATGKKTAGIYGKVEQGTLTDDVKDARDRYLARLR